MEIFSFLGRLHPLFVHLPIGFIILSILLEVYISISRIKINPKIISFSWFLSFISTLSSALFGWLLYSDGLYIEEKINLHRITGFILVFLVFIAWFFRQSYFRNVFNKNLRGILSFFIVLNLFVTGHFGGNITHGQNYLIDYAPEEIKKIFLEKETLYDEILVDLDSIKLYNDIVEPILLKKCVSCHNNNISQGDLNFSSFSLLTKGGISGSSIDKMNPRRSLIFKRITLPENNLKVMPPDGPKMSFDETNTILWWIKNFDKSEKELSLLEIPLDIQYSLNNIFNIDFQEKKWFDKIDISNLDDSSISKLSDSNFNIKFISDKKKFLSIKFLEKDLKLDEFDKLQIVKNHVAYLDISGVNISDNLFEKIIEFKNLIRLNLNNNKITQKEIKIIQGLENLQVLNLYGTNVSSEILNILKQFKSLKRVYVWNTKISNKQIENFNKENNGIKLIGGI